MIPRPDLPLILLEQGWRGLLPILPPDAVPAPWLKGDDLANFLRSRGKAPGEHLGNGVWALLKGWTTYQDDERTVETWAAWPGVGIGLRAFADDHLVTAIDIDILDPEVAGLAREATRKLIGRDAPTRIGQWPKEAFLVRTSRPFGRMTTGSYLVGGQKAQIEFLGAGNQLVIVGNHQRTGRPYDWPLGGPDEFGPEALPYRPVSQLEELRADFDRVLAARGALVDRGRAARPDGQAGEARPVEELRARKPLLVLDAALALRNGDWSYDRWVSLAYAIRGAFGDAGEALWLAFSAQSAKNVPSASASVWRDVTKAEARDELRSGAFAVIETARAEGWTAPADLPTRLPYLPAAPVRALGLLEACVAEAAEREARDRAQADAIFAGMGGAKAEPGPHYPADELDPAETTARLRAIVRRVAAEALAWTAESEEQEPPRWGVKAAAGLGKTVEVLEALAAIERPMEVRYHVPTVALATEAAAKAAALGLRTQVVRGREAVVDGEPLCRKHEEARIISRAGYPVTPLLCRKKDKRTGQEMTCPFFESCRYIAQFNAAAPTVRFFAHEYLWSPTPTGLPEPDLIVIDEAFALGAARHCSLGIDRLTSPRVGMAPEREALIHDPAVRVRDLLERGEDPRTAASAEQFALMADVEAELGNDEYVWPSMRWEEQKRRLATLRKSERFKLGALWRTLGKEAGRGGALQRVELRHGEPTADGELQDRVHVWWRAALRIPAAPVLLLDASLDARLARRFFPDIEVETIAARRNGIVIQVCDSTCSRTKLFGSAAKPAIGLVDDARRLLEVVGARRKMLAVTYKAAKERLGPVPGVDLAHFGALRGIDAYKHHQAVVVIGREQPRMTGAAGPKGHYVLGVEDYARSLFGDGPEPLALQPPRAAGEPGPRENRRVRTRDGRSATVAVDIHPDPRCQAILEQVRERETEQAIDRLRLVHRAEPALVILLSNLVVDVTVDRLVTWRDLMPSRLDVAAARHGGVLPLVPTWLAKRCPDLWATPKAAKHDVERAGAKAPTPIILLCHEIC